MGFEPVKFWLPLRCSSHRISLIRTVEWSLLRNWRVTSVTCINETNYDDKALNIWIALTPYITVRRCKRLYCHFLVWPLYLFSNWRSLWRIFHEIFPNENWMADFIFLTGVLDSVIFPVAQISYNSWMSALLTLYLFVCSYIMFYVISVIYFLFVAVHDVRRCHSPHLDVLC